MKRSSIDADMEVKISIRDGVFSVELEGGSWGSITGQERLAHPRKD
jgi:hypothetical protein